MTPSSIDPGLAAAIGSFLTLGGGICLALAVVTGRELRVMRETPTSSVTDLARLAPGSQVEVAGVLRCDAPLRAAFSDRPCAWFRAQVIHEERDPDAGPSKIGGRQDRVVADTERATACRIEDGSGAVALDLQGARIDGLASLREAQDVSAFSVSIAGYQVFGGDGRTSLGSDVAAIRREESILAIDAPVYALAVLGADGRLGAARPGERGRFLVSARGEAEFTRSNVIAWRVLAAIAGVALPGGLLGLGLGLVAWLAR